MTKATGIGRGKGGSEKRGPKRSPGAVVIDRGKITKLVRRGWTQVQIASELGIHQTMVSKEWRFIVKEIQDTQSEDAKAHIALMLEQYAEVRREAWEAWEKSKEDHRRYSEEEYIHPPKAPTKDLSGGKKSGDSKDAPARTGGKKITKVEDGRLPGAQYLSTILECLKAERELRGLNPAKEVKVSGTVDLWEVLMGSPSGILDATRDEVEEKIAGLLEDSGVGGERGEVIDVEGREGVSVSVEGTETEPESTERDNG